MKKIIAFIISNVSLVAFAQVNMVYTVPGNYTWTKPSFVDSIIVECWGGGGGGGIEVVGFVRTTF